MVECLNLGGRLVVDRGVVVGVSLTTSSRHTIACSSLLGRKRRPLTLCCSGQIRSRASVDGSMMTLVAPDDCRQLAVAFLPLSSVELPLSLRSPSCSCIFFWPHQF